MKTITFRKLRPNEIELRVGATKQGSGFSLLLYKTARVDANILDETFGVYGWQKRFYQVKNTMICEIGIYDSELGQWIFKGDAGDESNTEAIKGEASDSFKRAGFALGIGRELYTSPFIWVKEDSDNNSKTSRYSVKEIDYADNEISKLVIVNDKTNQVVFSMGSKTKVAQTSEKAPKNDSPTIKADTEDENAPIRDEEKEWLQNYVGQLSGDRYKDFFAWLRRDFGVSKITDLTASKGIIVVNRLKRAK